VAGKGAPQGNSYAKKEKRERGTNFSYYLDAYEKEFIEQALTYEGKEPTTANIRKKAKEWARQGISEGMRVLFAQYKQKGQN
jgi:hypothetical protein